MAQLEHSQILNKNRNTPESDEINLRELFSAIWKGKWFIIAVTFVFAVGGVFYAKSLPDIYKSEALLAPVSDNSSLKLSGQLGGLAALAGMSFGGASGGDKTVLAIEVLQSREFIGRVIDNNNLDVPLMAAVEWNREINKLIIDPEIYDVDSGKWIRKVSPPYKPKPSAQEVYAKFISMLKVSQDKTSGMINVSVEFLSPFLAKQWVDLLIKEINVEMRNRELIEAQRSIDFLNEQISQTDIADVRSMLFSLIEEQTKTVMLANVREEYVFKTIDSAVVSEKKSRPKRSLIVLLIVTCGGLLSLVLVLLRHFSRQR